MAINKIKKDLYTFSPNDIKTMYSFYKVSNILELIHKIYKKGYLPSIFQAIENNDIELVTEIINSPGFDINARNVEGETPLIAAIIDNKNDIVKLLISGGADLNLRYHGDTPLIIALNLEHKESAKLLIAGGADLNLQDSFGYTALMASIIYNNEIAKLLITGPPGGIGADLNIREKYGKTALQIAEQYHNIDLLLWIVNNDIKVPVPIQKKLKYYPELKIKALNEQIMKLKELLSPEEIEYLESFSGCIGQDIENLEKCKEMGEKMIKYKPGGKKMKKLEEKYKSHPYFS